MLEVDAVGRVAITTASSALAHLDHGKEQG